MLLDCIVFCAIIIGVMNGMSKIKGTSNSSYRPCDNLLDFLLNNK